jgi:general stress protein CsbA
MKKALSILLAYGLIYLFMGGSFAHTASTMMGQMISTSYINMSIFLAFATLYPDMQVLLYFIIPIKMKWMAAVYVVIMVFSIWECTYITDFCLVCCDITILDHLI